MSDHALEPPAAPERIAHPRFVLRCRDETDAPRFREAVDQNLDHLRRFMPWAWDEPRPVEELAARIRESREKFMCGEEWQFGIYSPDETRVLGAIGLHRGAAPATMEIGFWLVRSAEGQGIATEATRILTNLALTRLGAARVEIRCDARNERSAAVPRRLGYVLEDTRDEVYKGRPRQAQTWVRTQPVCAPRPTQRCGPGEISSPGPLCIDGVVFRADNAISDVHKACGGSAIGRGCSKGGGRCRGVAGGQVPLAHSFRQPKVPVRPRRVRTLRRGRRRRCCK